jgi:hypothetical protein
MNALICAALSPHPVLDPASKLTIAFSSGEGREDDINNISLFKNRSKARNSDEIC